jgi:glutaconate CoA-transferase subunit A
MKSLLTEIDEAASLIEPGSFIGIGGMMMANKPMALIHAILRRRPSELVVLPAAPSAIDIDLLVGSGCVRRVFVQAVAGGLFAAVGPRFRAASKSKSVEIVDLDQGMINTGLRAARFGLPSLPTRSGLGSDHINAAPDWLRMTEDPFTELPVLSVRALCPDIALVHASRADELGHAVQEGGTFNDELLCSAAKRVVVSVEEIVTPEEIKTVRARTFTWAHKVAAVVHAEHGAAPLASDGRYSEDTETVRRYLTSARTDEGFKEYFDDVVLTEVK